MRGVFEIVVEEDSLRCQPSYPLLVLHSLTSASPVLTIHSDLNSLLFTSVRGCPNCSEHPTPCSSGLSMMKERILGSGIAQPDLLCVRVDLESDEGSAWRFARCTDVGSTTIESRAVEIRAGDFLARGIGKGDRTTLGPESVSDGKTRSNGTSCPSFLRSLSIFCLRRLLEEAIL